MYGYRRLPDNRKNQVKPDSKQKNHPQGVTGDKGKVKGLRYGQWLKNKYQPAKTQETQPKGDRTEHDDLQDLNARQSPDRIQAVTDRGPGQHG